MRFIPQAFTQGVGWHFHCGPLRLCISADDFSPGELAPCAAEAAVVLDLAGELLDVLQAAGLASDADWQWDAEPQAASGAQAHWRGSDVEVALTLPWTLLRALDAAPDVPGLQFQPAPAECLLAQWRLSDAELAALEPGGLLLLDGEATPRLRARGESMAGEAWQLVARWDLPLPVETVMGWNTAQPALPTQCLLIEAARPDVVHARGRLLPWGSGQALRIDAV
jgi:hypothetical protein